MHITYVTGFAKTVLNGTFIKLQYKPFKKYIKLFCNPVKPYIKEIYRLINLDIVLGPIFLNLTREKIAIKMKAIFNQYIICVNILSRNSIGL